MGLLLKSQELDEKRMLVRPIWMERGFCVDVRILKCRGEVFWEGGGGHSTTIPPFPLISIDHNVEVELKEGTTTPMVESEENFWCSRTFNNLP